MKRFLFTLTALTLVFAAGSAALACKCAAPPPPKKAMEGSVAVFSGKCVGIVVNGRVKTVMFEVDRVWKGEIGKKVVITTPSDGAACGYGFTTEGDATYIVYAYGEEGVLATGLCTRTRTLANAKEDLKDLGDGEKPKDGKKEGSK